MFPIYLYKAPEHHVAILSFSGRPTNECRGDLSEEGAYLTRIANGEMKTFSMSPQEVEALVAAWQVFNGQAEMVETRKMEAITITNS